MAVTYTYQNTATLTRIAQDLVPVLTMNDPIFSVLPINRYRTSKLRWEIKDNYIGLMKLRGLGGEPTRINRIGANIYESKPGVYGEFQTVDEEEMTNRAAGIPANMDVPVNVGDLVSQAQLQMMTRQISRMRQISWTLALTGTFSVPLPDGGIGHTESYTPQTATVSPLWSTTTTATPLKNLRDLQPTYGRGTSNQFNQGAKAWMNSKTANYLLANSNAADLGGKRVEGGNTINDLPTINRILLGQGVPQIFIFDDGYLDDSGTFTLYIPDGLVFLVGQRPDGETPGEFMMTLNAVTNAPGEYSEVLDFRAGPARKIPPTLEVHAGFNGGPVIQRATQIVILTVA